LSVGCGSGERRSDDRRQNLSAGGKSGLRRAGWSLTATGGDPRESATENIPPGASALGKGEKARQELTAFLATEKAW